MNDSTIPTTAGADNTGIIVGNRKRIVSFNSAATTPPFEQTLNKVTDFCSTYGALHRGNGPNARKTIDEVDRAIESIRAFVGARPDHAVLFFQNSSAALNYLTRILRLQSNDVVLTSDIEHTSNNLPWRFNSPAEVIEIASDEVGRLDVKMLHSLLKKHAARTKVLTLTGASNVSGYVPDLQQLGQLAKQFRATFVIDAAQLAPHRQLNMTTDSIDALVFSAHKLYAPFGIGVLVLPRQLLDSVPLDPGGGSIDMLSSSGIIWSSIEHRHQTGTWNGVGIVALGESIRILRTLGWKTIRDHEERVTKQLVEALSHVPGCKLFIPPELYLREQRIGTIPFSLKGIHHALLAAALEHEYGIEVRAGTICNHRLVARWLQISNHEQRDCNSRIAKGDRLASYGIVRASVGIFNTFEDVDRLSNALLEISKFGLKYRYRPLPSEETFEPEILTADKRAQQA